MTVHNMPRHWAPSLGENTTTRAFYVDSVVGDDTLPGTSVEKPWRTLERLSQERFQPGDTIRFRRGQTFPGTFAPVGSGTPNNPVVVTSFGAGGKPVLDGGGALAAVLLHNVEGWELHGLEITNTGPAAGEGQQRTGIYVRLENFGTGRHYVIADVHVRDVNGPDMLMPVPSGGVIFFAGGADTPTGFDDIAVRDCVLSRVDRVGIGTQSHWSARHGNPSGRGTTHVPMTNVVVRDNRLQDIGGDGIVLSNGLGALVERNVLDDFAGRAASGTVVGMYSFNSDGGRFRHNKVCHGKKNAMAFDIESGDHDTVYEYNYSYRNNGGFLFTCNDPGATSDKAVFRHNISYDDRDGDGDWPVGVITLACGTTTNLRIHHNTVYAPHATRMVNNLGPTAAELTENVFIGRAGGSVINDPHGHYHRNIYHNVTLTNAPGGDERKPSRSTEIAH